MLYLKLRVCVVSSSLGNFSEHTVGSCRNNSNQIINPCWKGDVFRRLRIHDVHLTEVIFLLSLYHNIGLCWQHKQASAARTPRSREILNKGGESRRWKIPAGPILRLHMPSFTLTAGWLLAGQPVCSLSPRPEHTLTHTNTQTDTDADTHSHTHATHASLGTSQQE